MIDGHRVNQRRGRRNREGERKFACGVSARNSPLITYGNRV